MRLRASQFFQRPGHIPSHHLFPPRHVEVGVVERLRRAERGFGGGRDRLRRERLPDDRLLRVGPFPVTLRCGCYRSVIFKPPCSPLKPWHDICGQIQCYWGSVPPCASHSWPSWPFLPDVRAPPTTP